MVYVFLADGFEEMEAVAPIDILRRAGCEVVTVGIGKKQVTSSHGIPFLADITDAQVCTRDLEMVVLPGGMPGTAHLDASDTVKGLLTFAAENDLLIGAICAAPSVVGHMGLLRGRQAICYPGFEAELTGAEISAQPVCRDGNIITAKGAGVACEFGLQLAQAIAGQAVAAQIEKSIQCRSRA